MSNDGQKDGTEREGYRCKTPDSALTNSLVVDNHLNSAIARTLVARGVDTPEKARKFLSPSEELLHDPFLLPDMDKAVERIKKAVHSREKVLIHGDFDTDGLTSTALLIQTFNYLGCETDYYIPNRLDEGYGLNPDGIEYARTVGATLIITCDCGISSVNEIELAKDAGIDVIITDHHEPDSQIPDAIAVVDPKLPYSKYPFNGLAGVGVATKLILALNDSLHLDIPITNLLRICAIGTIADVVPLIDENRFIAHHGLRHLAATPNKGLLELFKVSSVNSGNISSYDISFRIAPRLNAAGRFGEHEYAIKLLLTRDRSEAAKLANKLNKINSHRQQLVEMMLNEALMMYRGQDDFSTANIIILGSQKWHKGLAGLIAAKMTETYNRPALIFAIDEDVCTGSARSIQEFNLVEKLGEIAPMFNRYGGHAMAAGFEFNIENLASIKDQLKTIANDSLIDIPRKKIFDVDTHLSLEELDDQFKEQYKLLEPFGFMNDRPTYIIQDLKLAQKPQLLKEKHLKLRLKDELGNYITALAWNQGDRLGDVERSEKIELVTHIQINKWRGKEELQLVAESIGCQ